MGKHKSRRQLINQSVRNEDLHLIDQLLRKTANGMDCIFFKAALANKISIINHLVTKYDYDINKQARDKKTALYIALCKDGDDELIQFLVNHGANLHIRYHDDVTILMCSACRMDSKFMRIFLEHGANVYEVDDQGQTALHIAAKRDNLAHMILLIEFGADINQKDYFNKKAKDYMTEGTYAIFIKELEQRFYMKPAVEKKS